MNYIKGSYNEEELLSFVNDKSGDGLTLLMESCANYHYDLIEMLTNEFSTDIGATDKEGYTAISRMIQNVSKNKLTEMRELEAVPIKTESEIYDVCIFISFKERKIIF